MHLISFYICYLQVKWQQQDVLVKDDAYAEMAAVKVSIICLQFGDLQAQFILMFTFVFFFR